MVDLAAAGVNSPVDVSVKAREAVRLQHESHDPLEYQFCYQKVSGHWRRHELVGSVSGCCIEKDIFEPLWHGIVLCRAGHIDMCNSVCLCHSPDLGKLSLDFCEFRRTRCCGFCCRAHLRLFLSTWFAAMTSTRGCGLISHRDLLYLLPHHRRVEHRRRWVASIAHRSNTMLPWGGKSCALCSDGGHLLKVCSLQLVDFSLHLQQCLPQIGYFRGTSVAFCHCHWHTSPVLHQSGQLLLFSGVGLLRMEQFLLCRIRHRGGGRGLIWHTTTDAAAVWIRHIDLEEQRVSAVLR